MPIYEYVCEGCAQDFEELVREGERPSCPRCGGERLRRKLSAFARPAAQAAPAPAAGACGSCGDPRGPGSCSL